jgi:GDPmannose 4,6-dehydratase
LSEIDLLDPHDVSELFALCEPDEVYNFAGVSSVAESWDAPVVTAQVNGELVAVLLDVIWQRRHLGRPTRLLQASSAEIFAGTTTSPQNETTRISPRSPYGASKAYAHQLVQVYRVRGLHAVNAILYNHESPRRPASFVTRKITRAVANISAGRAHDLVLGNLEARRDWGWAPDYVAGMVKAVRHDAPEDWVFATGLSSSVADFVAAAFRHVGISDWQTHVRTEESLERPADAPELVGDSARARDRLGWSPKVSFDDLVGHMVDADRAAIAALSSDPA